MAEPVRPEKPSENFERAAQKLIDKGYTLQVTEQPTGQRLTIKKPVSDRRSRSQRP